MVKATNSQSKNLHTIRRMYQVYKPNEVPLVVSRFKELDREFARQTKQLTALTKRMQQKVRNTFPINHDKHGF